MPARTAPRFIKHRFPLDEDRIVKLVLPVDLDDEEAERLCAFVDTLVLYRVKDIFASKSGKRVKATWPFAAEDDEDLEDELDDDDFADDLDDEDGDEDDLLDLDDWAAEPDAESESEEDSLLPEEAEDLQRVMHKDEEPTTASSGTPTPGAGS